MKWFTHAVSRDPSRVREVIQSLTGEITQALGENLESIVLYGNAVHGGVLGVGDDVVNLMFVLRHVDCDSLDKVAGLVVRAESEIPLATMTLTREELNSSCDVFPIKFHHIQQCHRVLSGEDVLSGLVISDDHLRLRCEQQLKNLMLRLRAIYLHRSQDPTQLYESLIDANRSFMLDIHACLVVKTGIVPEDDADLASAFGSEFGLDTTVVGVILRLQEADKATSIADLKNVFDRFMKLVHDSAIALDQMEISV